MGSHVWKISTLIPLSNFLKECPLGVQPLGAWNKHQWQLICIPLLEMGHICPHINIPMGAMACILVWVDGIVMKVLLFDRACLIVMSDSSISIDWNLVSVMKVAYSSVALRDFSISLCIIKASREHLLDF